MRSTPTPRASSRPMHSRGFGIVTAFLAGWLGTLIWTTHSSPVGFSRETALTLAGITLLLATGFLLWYDRYITARMRQARRIAQHISIDPSPHKRTCGAALTLTLTYLWLTPAARQVRHTALLALLLIVIAAPALWLLSALL